MKSLTLMKPLLLLLVAFSLSSCTDGIVTRNQLPAQDSAFIDEHFPGQTITYIERDGLSYEAHFNNGWEVDFTRQGEWIHVDCQRSAVPASILALLPQEIPAYVTTQFESLYITEIEKTVLGYEIGLNADLDLQFSLDGKFRRID